MSTLQWAVWAVFCLKCLFWIVECSFVSSTLWITQKLCPHCRVVIYIHVSWEGNHLQLACRQRRFPSTTGSIAFQNNGDKFQNNLISWWTELFSIISFLFFFFLCLSFESFGSVCESTSACCILISTYTVPQYTK